MTTVVDSAFPTLVNWAHRQKPDGGIADICDILSKKMPMLDDIPWAEGNLPTGHRVTYTANSLPTGTWRKINQGIAASKGETVQYDESCGMLEAESKVDIDLAKLNGDAAAYRASEDKMFIEGMSQQFSTAAFYESCQTNPERIHGLSPRYGGTTGYTPSSYVFRGGDTAQEDGTADNLSVWLITWEPRKIYGIFPKGSTIGLTREDKGEQRVLGQDGSNYLWAYVTRFQWKCGIAVEDYRYACRTQWDPSDESLYTSTSRIMINDMQRMLTQIYEVSPNTRFYMNRTSKQRLDLELSVAQANLLEYISLGGKMVPAFMGVPIRVTDSLVAESYIA